MSTLVREADAFGLVVWNYEEPGSGPIHINNSTFLNNSLGGIAIVGDANPVYISNCTIGLSRAAGISVWYGGFVRVLSTHVFGIEVGNIPPYDNLGDGIIAAWSDYVLVQNSLFEDCARAGLLYQASGGEIQWTQALGGRFGLVVQGDPKPEYFIGNSFVGTEEDILTDGALPVPQAPPIPEP